MARLSTKLRSFAYDTAQTRTGIAFWCPGCDGSHAVVTSDSSGKRPLWTWDGNVDAPTIAPSILVRVEWSKMVEAGDDPSQWKDTVCHSFVRAGMIQFLGDCTHVLAGKTMPLPD